MNRKVEVVLVVLLMLIVGISIKGDISGDAAIDLYDLFDIGEQKIDLLKDVEPIELYNPEEAAKLKKEDIKCPTQGTHTNTQRAGAEWSFKVGFKEGETGEGTGYLYPEGNNVYRLEWLDFYGFPGCELHFLEMKLTIDENNKKVTASNCKWYDGAQLETLSNLDAIVEDPQTGQCVKVPIYEYFEDGGKRLTGYVKQKSCGTDYRILNMKRCETVNIRLLDPEQKGYPTRMKGQLRVAFDVGTPLSNFKPLFDDGTSFRDVYNFEAEYIGPEKPSQEPEKKFPTKPMLVAGAGLASLIAAGLAAKMILSAHQKKMMAQAAAGMTGA